MTIALFTPTRPATHSRLPIGLPLSGQTKSYFDKWSASLDQAN